MMNRFVCFLTISMFLIHPLVAGPGVIKGKILDGKGNPLESANVYLKGTVMGAATNDQGRFEIVNAPSGNFILTISMIGFQLQEIPISVQEKDMDLGSVKLTAIALQSQPIIVTAGRQEQLLQDVPVSIGNVTSEEIEYRNAVSVNDALQYVSGLNLTGSQINIRGSSGYSRGVGSRVLMLLDGIPYMTGDTKETKFESLQINQVDRIEIVKGAGSALYGSSAIGGVINVISKRIEPAPLLNVQLYGGSYADAYYSQWKWTDKTRLLSGVKFAYSNKPGKIGFRIGASHDQNDSYKKNDWMKRYYLSGMLTIEISPFQELRFSTTYMARNGANFLYWKNLLNALVPPDDQLDDKVESQRWHISADYRHVLDHDRFYTAKIIWYRNRFDDNIGEEENLEGNQSVSDYWDGEFQYNFTLERHQLTLGLETNTSQVSSNIFSDKTGQSGALFVQDEFKWREVLAVIPGFRVDYFSLENVGNDFQINPKIGIVYKPWERSAFRGSAGRGFRAPSIAEVFTNTTASGLKVIPNLALKAEHSFSGELGYNHFLGKKIFFDLAVFYNRFWDLIEGTFNKEANIQFQNITNARSIGCEMDFSLSTWDDRIYYNFGYTFVDARKIIYEKGKSDISDYLTFRPRHLFYTQARFSWDDFQIGTDYRFISAWDKIDENLKIINDYDKRVPAHILDLRFIYSFFLAEHSLKTSFQINNLLQYHYVDLVGSIAPTRQFVLTLSGDF